MSPFPPAVPTVPEDSPGTSTQVGLRCVATSSGAPTISASASARGPVLTPRLVPGGRGATASVGLIGWTSPCGR